ncbi:MAG: hypothetical protein KAJ15_04450 [Spirochaetes bacterium]|nr:hypothetical protein [Spirochaetota bacterium]
MKINLWHKRFRKYLLNLDSNIIREIFTDNTNLPEVGRLYFTPVIVLYLRISAVAGAISLAAHAAGRSK